MSTQFVEFLTNLGAFESGIDTTKAYGAHDLDWLMVFNPDKGNVDRSSVDLSNPDDLATLQYHVHNTLGFLGKYQFGEPLLIDLGYYTPAPSGFYGTTATNEWQGTWTGKNGVYSKEDFMSHAQEYAIRDAFAMNMGVIETRLAQAGHSIDDFLGAEFTYTRFGVEHTATVSMSGILASAHLQGPGGVANLLLNNVASSDEYGTNILYYMDEFGGYATPFGTAADDTLSGSDYGEVFSGETGDNVYTTGGGDDLVTISVNSNGTDTITDFDINNDVLSLAAIEGADFDSLDVSNDQNGNAVIHLANQQTVVLNGVDAAQLNASHFVNGPVVMNWAANSGDTVIDHFNLSHDVIDLNYAFGSNNLAIYDENGSSVVEVVGNNQRLILQDVPLNSLSAFHFIKAPIDFATVFFSDGSVNEPPPVDDTPPTVDDIPNDPTPPVVSADDIYAFTWNWGSDQIVNDFDVNNSVIDLQGFWTDYSSFDLYNDAQGNAVIDLSLLNNQTITIAGVSIDDLSAANFRGVSGQYPGATVEIPDEPDPVPEPDPTPDPMPEPPVDVDDDGGVYAFTWNWGADQSIDNFDVAHDVVNLQGFWTDYNSFSIHDDVNGNAVIDLTDLNNQSITLNGISTAELSADNIIGVAGHYQDAVDISVSPPPVVDDDTPPVDNGSNDVFTFTWNWGAQSVIEDFDAANDAVDLKSFWTSRDQVPIYDNAEGNAVIDLGNLNNQTITIEGVSAHDLSDNNVLF